jgi:hypothetical protein
MTSLTNAPDEFISIGIDKNINNYASFYDANWAGEFSSITEPTTLSEAGLDLILCWKGAAYTAAMPFLLVNGLRDILVGVNAGLQTRIPVSIAGLPGISEIWESYMKIPGFTIVLWSSQRTCYGAMYHAYEHFLRVCVAVAAGVPTYKGTRPQLIGKLNEIMGSVGDECLGSDAVTFAADIRNSLAHNGGRSSPDIESRAGKYNLEIAGGRVHIRPANTRELFVLLEQKAMIVARMAKNNPQFQRPQPGQ